MQKYIAHRNEHTGLIQTVKEHSENTAALCREYAVPALKEFMYAVGLLHDCGKYQTSFAKRINGANIRVEHSTCGALAAREQYEVFPMALMMAYCIAGHHSGIPDGGFPNDDKDEPTLQGRMHRSFEDFSAYKEELALPELDGREWLKYLVGDCGNKMEMLIDKFAFLTRYAFSCLVDADTRDTADFCSEGERPEAAACRFFRLSGTGECQTGIFCLQDGFTANQGGSSIPGFQPGETGGGNLPAEYAHREREDAGQRENCS